MNTFRRLRANLALMTTGALLVVLPGASAFAKTTLTVALETDARGFDAVKGGVLGASAGTVSHTIHDTLFIRDLETGEMKPGLAESWSQSDDKKTFIVKLKKGVEFHDGSPFTAKDAADHLNRILDPKNKSRSRSFITAIEGAKAIDEHTVEYTLKHPWQPFVGALASINMIGLIPSHKNVEADKQNRHPVGTGPYRFKNWAGGDRIVVERNPRYHVPGVAKVDEIVFRILPDTQARFAALKAGEVDVIWTDRGNTIKAAQKDNSLKVIARPGKGAKITFLNASKPPLDDVRVRQALAHAWNQTAILNVTWKNTVPFARHALGADAECDDGYLDYDPEKAKALLADYAEPVSLEMIHTTTPRGRELGEIMQQLFKQVGVGMKLVPVDQNTLVKKVFTNDYQISGWRVADADDVGPQLYALSFSDSRYNLTRLKNEQLDKAATVMRTAATPAARDKGLCDLSRLINQSGNMQLRGGNKYYVITRKNVNNVAITVLGRAQVAYAWKE
ncbi:MAG: ABC transporter substrate-binding protein [Gammaproteobacteria bacterium]|nr:ABC transporter substrate-binding protein [Gammaproteobacteria bacterium]